jgi:hypothetical protein
MNSQQAKFILQGYRPDGSDATDETFTEALDHARQDIALGQWLAQSTAFDRAVAAKLSEVVPPAGLREAILAGGKVTVPDQTRATSAWWRQPAWLGLAASIALVGALALALWPRPNETSLTLTDFALANSSSFHGHLDYGAIAANLQTKMSEPTTAVGRMRPVDYAALRDTGCRTVKFQGRDVLEVCFKRNGLWFHCYIAQRTDFPTMAATLAPSLADYGKASIASWSDAAHLYVLVSHTGRVALEKIL